MEILIPTSGCKGTNQEVRYLEHVEVKTNINYTVRGALQIYLLSPSGKQQIFVQDAVTYETRKLRL